MAKSSRRKTSGKPVAATAVPRPAPIERTFYAAVRNGEVQDISDTARHAHVYIDAYLWTYHGKREKPTFTVVAFPLVWGESHADEKFDLVTLDTKGNEAERQGPMSWEAASDLATTFDAECRRLRKKARMVVQFHQPRQEV